MGGPATARARPRSALPGLLREAGAARTVVSRPQKKTHGAKSACSPAMCAGAASCSISCARDRAGDRAGPLHRRPLLLWRHLRPQRRRAGRRDARRAGARAGPPRRRPLPRHRLPADPRGAARRPLPRRRRLHRRRRRRRRAARPEVVLVDAAPRRLLLRPRPLLRPRAGADRAARLRSRLPRPRPPSRPGDRLAGAAATSTRTRTRTLHLRRSPRAALPSPPPRRR